MNTAAYSEILDFGREKMNEGDYLKLAMFLGNLHNAVASAPEVFRETTNIHNVSVEFDTVKGKHIVVKIDSIREVVYRGAAKPNDDFISGSVNGVAFTNMIDTEFTNYWVKRIAFYGAKNIKRSFDNIEADEFKHFGLFKQFCLERDVSIERSEEEEPDYDAMDFCATYFVNVLFGIDHLTTAH